MRSCLSCRPTSTWIDSVKSQKTEKPDNKFFKKITMPTSTPWLLSATSWSTSALDTPPDHLEVNSLVIYSKHKYTWHMTKFHVMFSDVSDIPLSINLNWTEQPIRGSGRNACTSDGLELDQDMEKTCPQQKWKQVLEQQSLLTMAALIYRTSGAKKSFALITAASPPTPPAAPQQEQGKQRSWQ